MKILFDTNLFPREFGSDVFNVPDLLNWAKGKGFHLETVPPLDDYDYAQAEYVLSLIANSPLHNSTADEAAHEAAAKEAAAYVATKPKLAQHPAAGGADGWLAGAYAGEQWRVVFSKAIANGELVLLDFYSRLPVAIAAAPTKGEAGAVTSPSGDDVEAVKRGITKQQVINAFDGLCFDRDKWGKYLADPPDWLMECRVTPGVQGRRTSATWNPVLIAAALYGDEGKKIAIKKLDAVFVRLNDWADEWREVSASFRD